MTNPVDQTGPRVLRTEEEWRTLLTPEEYRVLRQAGTERPFTGEYETTTTPGTYRCRACGAELFRSNEKFDAHCGWPAFWSPLAGDRVVHLVDDSLGMRRIEVRCARCNSHLGHVFEGEGFDTPTDLRYCINSISLTFDPGEETSGDPGEETSGDPGEETSGDPTHPD